jgi:uncharacterized membrane protein YedE/YeeE
MTWLVPLFLGAVFGALLERGGLTRYVRVAGVFRFTDLALVKFLLAALASGAIAVQAALSLGLVTTLPVTPTHVAANLVGGALFGVGMALAGFCPGTILAGAGSGRLDALVPGGLGLLAGAWAFDHTGGAWREALAGAGDRGPTTVPTALGVSGWLVVVLLVEVTVLVFRVLERRRRGRAR